MVRIFSRKAIGFRNHETNQIIIARALNFAELPDWVEKDPMLSWAVQDGTIDVIEGSDPKTEKTVPQGDPDTEDEGNPGGTPTTDPDDLNSLSKEDLKVKAKELNLPYSGKSKEELIEMIQGA